MLLGTAVRALLWTLLAVLLVAVFFYLAIDLGIVDLVFHGDAKSKLDWWKAFLREKYRLNKDTIDNAVKIVGLAVTSIYGALQFLRAWHFAKINLPLRFQQYADRIREAHVIDRIQLLAPYWCYNLRGDRVATAELALSDTLFSYFTATTHQKAIQQLTGSVSQLDGDISILHAKLDTCEPQRISAHLIAAYKLEAEARSLPQGSAPQNAKYAEALTEVRAALKLDECDLDALEHAAKLARCLNTKGALIESLNKFEQEAQLQKKPVRYARALRFQAEVLEERATRGALNAARIKLETGLESLEDPAAGDERPYELALLNEQLASLHIKRGTPTLVDQYLDVADEIYKTLPAPEGPAGLVRIEHLRTRLEQALRGGDELEELAEYGDELIVERPTHVNSEPLQVSKEIGQIGDLGPKLEPFTALTVQSEHGNWALVARENERLGYVDRTKLHKLL